MIVSERDLREGIPREELRAAAAMLVHLHRRDLQAADELDRASPVTRRGLAMVAIGYAYALSRRAEGDLDVDAMLTDTVLVLTAGHLGDIEGGPG